MKLIYAALALAALFHVQSAHAECRKIIPDDEADFAAGEFDDNGVIDYNVVHHLSFESSVIDVDSTLPIGETIARGSSYQTNRVYILRCDDATGTIPYELSRADSGITDDPTVGYRVVYERASGATETFPYTNNFVQKYPGVTEYVSLAPGAKFHIELIKLAEMQSQSTINLGQVGRVYGGGGGGDVITIISNPVTLRVLPHCQVTSAKPLLVEFGPFGPRDVSATSGPTRPVTINVACDGPTPPNTVSATLAAPPDPDATGFIRNDGSASGLAIRLRDAATQAVLKPQDLSSVLTKGSPGYNTTFDLEASVLRVGAAAPVPGSIDAQGVVTLTFL